jgi:hypothetical protein
MSEIERRIVEDALAANRFADEHRSMRQYIELQQEYARGAIRPAEIIAPTESILARMAWDAERSFARDVAAGSLSDAARRAVEEVIRPGSLAEAARHSAAWLENVIDLHGSVDGLTALERTIRDLHIGEETALSRVARHAASLHAEEAAMVRDLARSWTSLELRNASLLNSGLRHGWASSSLAIGLAPGKAIAILASELDGELERDDPTAVRTLSLAAGVSAAAAAVGQDLAEVMPTGPAEHVDERLAGVQAALPQAVEHPLVLFHALGRELIAVGERTPADQLRVNRQRKAFMDVALLVTACRRESVARRGADLFGVSPDAIDAQMLLTSACVEGQATATTVLAAMYVLLCESADAGTLKDYRRLGLTLPGWVNVEDVVRVLRNNMGTLHERDGTGRYTSARKALKQLGVTGFPTLAEEWTHFGDRLATVAVEYLRGLRDFLGSH